MSCRYVETFDSLPTFWNPELFIKEYNLALVLEEQKKMNNLLNMQAEVIEFKPVEEEK